MTDERTNNKRRLLTLREPVLHRFYLYVRTRSTVFPSAWLSLTFAFWSIDAPMGDCMMLMDSPVRSSVAHYQPHH